MSLTELQNLQFNIKFTSKQFAKSSTRCEKDEKKEILKCKQAMQKGNMAGARIFAENAIRKKNEGLNMLRLAARMDAVASRLDTAIKMKTVTKAMGGMVKGMDKVLTSMDPAKVTQLMDTFEGQFETMDVTSEYMQNAIGQSTATATPEGDVAQLMAQVADEHGLDVRQQLGEGGPIGAAPQAAPAQKNDAELDELSARLAALGGK